MKENGIRGVAGGVPGCKQTQERQQDQQRRARQRNAASNDLYR